MVQVKGGDQGVEEAEAMKFYRGRKLAETDLVAMGTVETR
jgi:hypothetical protein